MCISEPAYQVSELDGGKTTSIVKRLVTVPAGMKGLSEREILAVELKSFASKIQWLYIGLLQVKVIYILTSS